MITLAAQGIAAGFDPRTGQIATLEVTDAGRVLAPLHRAPWVGTDEAMPPGADPLIATLGGDFFCAPFAGHEDGSPLHGWPANTEWLVVAQAPGLLRAVLARPVMGATLIKELSLSDGHPFLYQRHIFIGGQGRLAAANHANVAVPGGAHIRASQKAGWETSAAPQETDPAMGRSALRYPARTSDPTAFPSLTGTADLTTYPWADRSEDFCIGVEAADSPLGWTAVTRLGQGDVFLSLRDPRRLPMTMLWQSNGGRDYAPWSGRHTGCLGVEEGAADTMLGVSTEADLAGPGALRLRPDGITEMRHVIGAIDWPGEAPMQSISMKEGRLTLRAPGGAERTVPIRADFVTGAA